MSRFNEQLTRLKTTARKASAVIATEVRRRPWTSVACVALCLVVAVFVYRYSQPVVEVNEPPGRDVGIIWLNPNVDQLATTERWRHSPGTDDVINFANHERGGRIEEINGDLRFGVEPLLLLDGSEETFLRLPLMRDHDSQHRVSVTISWLAREMALIHEAEVVLIGASPLEAPPNVNVLSSSSLGNAFKPVESLVQLRSSKRDDRIDHINLRLREPICARFIRFDIECDHLDKILIAELRVLGTRCPRPHPYNLLQETFATSVSVDQPHLGPAPAVAAISGLVSGQAGDAEDLLWYSGGNQSLPLDMVVRFPERTALIQSIVLDTRVAPLPADTAPATLEVWRVADDEKIDPDRLATLAIPDAAGVHKFDLQSEPDAGYLARALRFRLLSNHGNAVRTSLRDLRILGYYHDQQLPETIDLSLSPPPYRVVVDWPTSQRLRLSKGSELRAVLKKWQSLAKPLLISFSPHAAEEWQIQLVHRNPLEPAHAVTLAGDEGGSRQVRLAASAVDESGRPEFLIRAPESADSAEIEITTEYVAEDLAGVDLEPNGSLVRPQRIDIPFEAGTDVSVVEHTIRGGVLGEDDVDIFSFVATSTDVSFFFVLSEIEGYDGTFAVLGPDPDSRNGLRRGSSKPKTQFTVNDLTRTGREVYSGWSAPERGEYFVVVGAAGGKRAAEYEMTIGCRR